eukprot:4034764-Prymnesium_polylepis.1
MPGYTGVDSALLDRSRNAVGTILGLVSGVPEVVEFYKRSPAFFKFFAGLMEALLHLAEILAGLAFALYGRMLFDTPAILLFYAAPLIQTLVSFPWTCS